VESFPERAAPYLIEDKQSPRQYDPSFEQSASQKRPARAMTTAPFAKALEMWRVNQIN
jgi:hypothetical protein